MSLWIFIYCHHNSYCLTSLHIDSDQWLNILSDIFSNWYNNKKWTTTMCKNVNTKINYMFRKWIYDSYENPSKTYCKSRFSFIFQLHAQPRIRVVPLPANHTSTSKVFAHRYSYIYWHNYPLEYIYIYIYTLIKTFRIPTWNLIFSVRVPPKMTIYRERK